ncbi:MAG: AAA family ATPase [Planctomycetota bacterium]
MKIRDWHIDGFGVFHDFGLEHFPDGMTVFLGPNEAGKSTLLGFLRGILFGYPSGRSRDPDFPPLKGGRHGGKIVIDVEGKGFITIARYTEKKTPVVVTLSDGSQISQAELVQLLGGADRNLFQQIFAFSLSELQELQTLKSEEVRDRIFSAGIAGAGHSATEAIRRLEKEIRDIHAPRRRTTKVANLLKRFRELSDELREARNQAARYSEFYEQEEKCHADIQEATENQESLRQQVERYKLLMELWPTCQRLEGARTELSQLEAVDEFPPEPERRMSEVTADYRAAQVKLDDLVAAHKAKADQCESFKHGLKDKLAQLNNEVEAHHEDLRLHRDHLNQMSGVQQRIDEARRDLEDALRSLGPQWDRSRLEAFDTSLPREEEVRNWKERLTDAVSHVAEAVQPVRSIEKQIAFAIKERDRIQARHNKAKTPDEATLTARESALAQFSELWAKEENLQTRADGYKALVEDRQRTIESLPNAPATGSATSVILTGLGALAAGITAAWRFAVDDKVGFAVLACLGIAFAVAVWLLKRKKGAVPLPAWLDDGLRWAKQQYDETCKEAENVRTAISKQAEILVLSVTATREELSAVEKKLREERRALSKWQDAQTRLQEANNRLQEYEEEREELQRDLDRGQNAQDQAEQDWQQWKAGCEIPEGLTPDGVLAFLPRVEAARERVRKLDSAKEALNQLHKAIIAWQKRARELLARANTPLAHDDAPEGQIIDSFLQLRNACRKDAGQRQELIQLRGEIADLEANIEAARKQVKRSSQRRDKLLAEAGVIDEPAFWQKHEIFKQRQEFQGEIGSLERIITDRVGLGLEADKTLKGLRSGLVDEWQQARLRAEQELQQVVRDHEEAVRQHQDAMKARKTVEESADVPAIEIDIENVRCELVAALNEWQIKSIAKAVIETTLAQFVRDRQPGVLAEASRMFEKVTDHNYQEVVVEPDGQSLAIIDRSLGRKKPEELSRGTAEQLYLCLRLALAREFAQQLCPLPIVMDDVLVNFDPTRAQAMAEVLTSFAELNQVLLFTCHPETVQILQEKCAHIRVEQMHP